MECKISKQRISSILVIVLFGIIMLNGVSATSDFVNLDEYDIEYVYDEAVAGDRFTIAVTITNQDNEDKSNVIFEFDEEDPFEFIGDDDWNIGDLNEGESVTKNFRIEIDEDADSDDYEI